MTEIYEVITTEVDFMKFLKRSKLTIAELARRTGIHYTRLYNYKRGLIKMTPDTWNRIKKVLDEAYDDQRKKDK